MAYAGTTVHNQLQSFVYNFVESEPEIFNKPDMWNELYTILQSGAQFIQTEVDVNAQHEQTGVTMLYCAIQQNMTDLAVLLIEQNADVNLQDYVLGNTPLHAAVKKNNNDIIQYLYQSGAQLNTGNKQHQTPLHIAVLENNATTVATLLNCKANPNMYDIYGKRPIDYAIARQYEDIVYLLQKR